MTDSSPSGAKSPFARSIDALFDSSADEERAAEVQRSEVESEAPEPLVEGGATPETEAVSADQADAALKSAVAGYMQASGEARAAAAAAVQSAMDEARKARRAGPMADTVSALARLGGSRPEALELARSLMDEGLASVLVSRVIDAPPNERGDRVKLLGQLGEEGARGIARALHDTDDRGARRALLDAMVQVGPGSPVVIEEMVEDGRWFVVRNAVNVLGEMEGDVALHHLTGTIVHDDPRVRRETVVSLQKIEEEGAAVLILGRLEDDDPSVRAVAARAVGALELAKGVRALLSLLERENDEDVIVAACRALGSLGDPSAVSTLEKRATASFFSKPPTAVRVAAYQALAAIGTPHAVSLLDDARSDKDAAVRSVATEAIRLREG